MLTVRAPATSANLGPGYDCLSLALDVGNIVEAWPAESGVQVEVIGEGAALLPTDATNEVYRALAVVYARHGSAPPPIKMRCHNLIPPSRGLGSSSAARASGLLLGNRLLGEPFSLERLFAIGAELEGHPDNIAACLFGGVQVCVTGRNGLEHLTAPVTVPLATTVYIPDFPMDTHSARGLLPTNVPVETAVHNISRSSLFIAALAAGRPEMLRTATEDAIHQPPRSTIFPALPALIEAALDAGAYGAFLSGAGSSVMALTDPSITEQVGAAMALAASRANVPGRVLQAGISATGATVTSEEVGRGSLSATWNRVVALRGQMVETVTGAPFSIEQVTADFVTIRISSSGSAATVTREQIQRAVSLKSPHMRLTPSEVRSAGISERTPAYIAGIVNAIT